MSATNTRRAFFLRGGAVALGAGVAATVAAPAVATDDAQPVEDQLRRLREQLLRVEDREAIRQLHLAFTTAIEQHSPEAAAQLFDEQARLSLSGVRASGKAAIQDLLADHSLHQKATLMHNAYRPSALQQRDAITLSESGQEATSTFHVEVELCTPLPEDCTAAKMARLQGHVVDRRWERGRIEASYVKRHGQWRVSSLSYLAS